MKNPLLALLVSTSSLFANYDITFESLLNEMADRAAVAQWPEHEYKALLHSSYNRDTKTPEDERGWFANGDRGYAIREEQNQGRKEVVMMEHEGPGVLTRLWTPFFYWSYGNKKGETIRIYLDGKPEPVIETNFIELIREGWLVKAPFSQTTPRAGDLYLPIPFGKSCKVTIEKRSFFYNINFRAYLDLNLKVETFTQDMLTAHRATMERVGKELQQPSPVRAAERKQLRESIAPGKSASLPLSNGSHVIQELRFNLKADEQGQALRSTVLEINFDGESTIWCPLGDFFATVRTVEPYKSWERDVLEDGTMICRWLMPYEKSATLTLHNLGKQSVAVEAAVQSSPITWTDRMMHFYAVWTTLGPLPPNPKLDMNFVDIQGRGIHVGDNISVVNPYWAWWGEGDEKIWVDDDFARNFPSQIGTGTEDYYGWAGGRHPTRNDEFDSPFLVNVRVGGEPMPDEPNRAIHTRGYNTCTRTRALDANLFRERFKFDMEHWNFGRGKANWLHYAKVAFWYAQPGSTHNRTPLPEEAAKPLETPESLEAQQFATGNNAIDGALDFESILTRTLPSHVKPIMQKVSGGQFNNDTLFFMQGARQGDHFEFTITEQYADRDVTLYMVKAQDFGTIDIYINDEQVKKNWDGFSKAVSSEKLPLGKFRPVDNLVKIKFVVTGKNSQSKGVFLGLDCVVVE